MESVATRTTTTFSSLSAAERAAAVLDGGTFAPLTTLRSGDSLAAGSGRLRGDPALVAFMDGHIRGGTLGVREARILAGLLENTISIPASEQRPAAVIVGFDTGGVRVEEGPIALAAASGVAVCLARLTLMGIPVAAVISGPRGCFGAPAVMAALPDRILITENAHWGLTGPKLLGGVLDGPAPERAALQATSAATKVRNGDAHAVVADRAAAIRAELHSFVRAARGRAASALPQRIIASAAITADLQRRLQKSATTQIPPQGRRRRDLLQYSFRGQWKPTGPIQRRGLIHAALGTLGGRPALGFIIGPEQQRGAGVGIDEAAVVTDMIRIALPSPGAARAAVLTFLFCQGHAVDFAQERFGLPRALAECLRAMVAARLLGHPIVTVLGGGTYGAAYLALAAPSHRILAMRGTSVAPMAPEVLRAFQALRGVKRGHETEAQLADLIPDVRIVESVIRLPSVLREELLSLVENTRLEIGV